MPVGLMLLKEAKTLTALKHQESLPTLSRTLNVYEWSLDELFSDHLSPEETPPETGKSTDDSSSRPSST